MNIKNKDRIIPQKPLIITDEPYRYRRHHTYYYKGREADKTVVLNYLREMCNKQKEQGNSTCTLSVPQIVSDMAFDHSFSVDATKKVLIDLYEEYSGKVNFISTSLPVIVHLCHHKQDHIMLNMCIHKQGDSSHFTHIQIRNFEEALK